MATQTSSAIDRVTTEQGIFLVISGRLCFRCRDRLEDEVDEDLGVRVIVKPWDKRIHRVSIRDLRPAQERVLIEHITIALEHCAKGIHG